jgi:hypothetical protein
MSDVKRYDCTDGGAQWCQGCYTMTENSLGGYVKYEDYDALRGEVERLRETLQSISANTCCDRCREAALVARAALAGAAQVTSSLSAPDCTPPRQD